MSEKDPSQRRRNAQGKLQPVHAKTFEILDEMGKQEKSITIHRTLGIL